MLEVRSNGLLSCSDCNLFVHLLCIITLFCSMASCCKGENELHKEEDALEISMERRSSNCFGVGCAEMTLHDFMKCVTSGSLDVLIKL